MAASGFYVVATGQVEGCEVSAGRLRNARSKCACR
jgi:hypothetical protein